MHDDGAEEVSLTPREREVLHLLVAGCSDKEIALALGMRQRTATHHVGIIRRKLGAPSRTGAAAIAVQRDLLST
jgi:DNA-binding CsgD family transcriptional regulator